MLPRPIKQGARTLASVLSAAGISPLAGSEGWEDALVSGASQGSAQVYPGYVFIAVPGQRWHGAKYIAQARDNGAVAVITDTEGAQLWKSVAEYSAEIPVVSVNAVNQVAGQIASAAFGSPAQSLGMYAVTGTNGKTTTTYILRHCLAALGQRAGMIGTVEIAYGQVSIPSVLTTPQPAQLHQCLAAMVEDQVQAVVMEVSSHAISQKRTAPIRFAVAGFSNLTQDHLDFHHTMEEYFQAKAELFAPEQSEQAVVLVDDAWGQRLAAQLRRSRPGTVHTVAVTGQGDYQVQNARFGAENTRFTMRGPGGETSEFSTNLLGEFNLANVALALAMLAASGVELATLQAALPGGELNVPVPGRMEVLSQIPRIIVDFAHNPDALQQALVSLRPTTTGKLWVLTGAAGERDATKRPIMGKICAELADEVVITDDDPHGEDPGQIRQDVLNGCYEVVQTSPSATDKSSHVARVQEIGDRTAAIHYCVEAAHGQDTILVAGRGHETIQEVGNQAIALDDRLVVKQALRERMAAGGRCQA